MGKKSSVLTREQREAIELLNKLTNKARNELSGFWNANQNQFKQNRVALKEVLKKAIREDKNGDKEEMFNFFWSKLGEVKASQKGKKNQKGLEINESFINEMVIEAALSGNYRYIENLGEKIGYERLLNNGKTFRIILEVGRIDMFKQLYSKVYDLYKDKKGNISIKTIATAIEAAAQKNLNEVLDFCVEKEESNPDSKLLGVWKETIKTLIQKGNLERAEERLNAIERQAGIMNNNVYKEIMEVATVNNANAIFDHCLLEVNDKERIDYRRIFMAAVTNDNAYVIAQIGKEISNDILKASLAAKIDKRERLKNIEKTGEDGNIINVTREEKDSAIKTTGDYIISQDKSQLNDGRTVKQKSEEIFNRLQREANESIDLISKILIDRNEKNREYVNDVKANPTLARYYAQNITIGDRMAAETEKLAQKDTKFREESKEIVQEISSINNIVTMQARKGYSFSKKTRELLEASGMFSKQAKKLMAASSELIVREIKVLGSKLRRKPSKSVSKDLGVKNPDIINTAVTNELRQPKQEKKVTNIPRIFSNEQIMARKQKSFSKIASEKEFEELPKAIPNKIDTRTQQKIDTKNKVERLKSNDGPKFTI